MNIKALAMVLVALARRVAVAPVQAQTYPSRPVTLIVPFPAGGITDIVARIVGEKMKDTLGQPVIVENVGGAGGTIGVTRLFRSPPDGYTIAIGQWSSHVGAAAMYPLPFDYLKDFEPISMLSIGPLWIIGRKDFPANNTKELIAWLKANPNKATGGTIGIGSAIHMCLIYFADKTGTTMQYVPYRGAAPMLQDVLAGQIDLSCPEAGQTLSQYRAGNFKAYAVLTEKRWFAAPDVPTMDEIGVPGVHFPVLAWAVGAEGHAEGRHRQAQRGGGRCAGRSGGARASAELGHEVPPREQQTPEALAAAQGRDRKVGADHQGGQHQAAMSRAQRPGAAA